MQILPVPVCIRPDTMDINDQDCMATLCGTRLVENSSCYPRTQLTITCCSRTFLIPTDIKFGMIFDKCLL